ncbi:MAG: IS21-like element helper ATPase IstB [Planctomycetales bacterium]
MNLEQTRKLLSEGVLPSPAPTQDVEALRVRLQALKLRFAAEALGDFLNDAVKENWSPAAFLDALLRRELERQEERRIAQALRNSRLPIGPTLSNFDFAFQPAVSRSRIETLATCQWIADRHGLLIMGQPGVGKSHLAKSLGVRAVESGFSVSYYRIDELLHQLKKDADLSPARLKYKKYMATSLLIIDEMGFDPFTRDEASWFFRVVSHRYQRGSICITTNKGIADWPELFAGDEALAGAILDRLLHSAHVLSINGRSYRLKELDEELQRRNGSSPPSPPRESLPEEEPPA